MTKQHTRLQAVAAAEYKFYPHHVLLPKQLAGCSYPANSLSLVPRSKGEYRYGDAAWEFVQQYTGLDSKAILENIPEENTKSKGSFVMKDA